MPELRVGGPTRYQIAVIRAAPSDMMRRGTITKGDRKIPMNTSVLCHRCPSAVARCAAVVLLISSATPVFAESSAAGSTGEARTGASQDAARSEFERQLEQRDFGTYMMYKRLPAASRDEVFRSYGQGASPEQVKAAVLNAFLHK